MRLDMNTTVFEDIFQGPDPEEVARRKGIASKYEVPCSDGETKMVFQDVDNVELIGWADLTDEEKEEFDYYDNEEDAGWFFEFNGQIFDFGDFMRVPKDGDLAMAGWYGMKSGTHSSGWVVGETEDSGPYEAIKVARVYWTSI